MVHDEQLMELIPEWRGQARTVTALGGGLTNRNFRVEVNGGTFVLRVPGENTALLGINRHWEAACSRAAAALGVGPEVVTFLSERELLVRRFVPGQVLTAEQLKTPEVLRRVVEAIRRFHQAPMIPGRFSPFATVRQYGQLARERGVELPPEFEAALKRMAVVESELGEADAIRPCHNDLLAANLIDDGGAVRIIDWEYGGMGDLFFDLGNLAVNNEFGREQEELLLMLYFGAVRPEDVRRVRLMRLASDMREAAWGYLQAGISKLEEDFLGYGWKHLQRFLNGSARAEN